MTAARLPLDVERCAGVGSDAEGWREGCDDCLRRTCRPDDASRLVWMQPPLIIAFWCEARIEP